MVDENENTVSDGFGSEWCKCERPDCGIEVVRPGKSQCWCDWPKNAFAQGVDAVVQMHADMSAMIDKADAALATARADAAATAERLAKAEGERDAMAAKVRAYVDATDRRDAFLTTDRLIDAVSGPDASVSSFLREREVLDDALFKAYAQMAAAALAAPPAAAPDGTRTITVKCELCGGPVTLDAVTPLQQRTGWMCPACYAAAIEEQERAAAPDGTGEVGDE